MRASALAFTLAAACAAAGVSCAAILGLGDPSLDPGMDGGAGDAGGGGDAGDASSQICATYLDGSAPCPTAFSCSVTGCSCWADWPMPNSPDDAGSPNPLSYDTSTPGVVVDNVTALMWQRVVAATTFTWADAAAYCAQLDLAGHTDWRLPCRIELVSLIDYQGAGAVVDPVAFPNAPTTQFWSSSRSAADPASAWFVAFYDVETNTKPMSSLFAVRCVR